MRQDTKYLCLSPTLLRYYSLSFVGHIGKDRFCDAVFSPRVSESRPSRVATRVGFEDGFISQLFSAWENVRSMRENQRYVDNRMELVRHRTTVLWQSYEVIRLHYDCLPRSWSQHLNMITFVQWLCDLVRCRKKAVHMAQHRAHENMWIYGTNIRDVADVKRCRTTSRDDCTIHYNLGYRNQAFEYDQKPPRRRASPPRWLRRHIT